MARKVRKSKDRKQESLGKLPPQYKFFLNPYSDIRFTSSCPGCSKQTKQRKLPLAIHVTDWGMVILNKTCRFCPACDLLIAHQDEIEGHLAQLSAEMAPQVIAKDYVVVGTVERKDWRRGMAKPLSNEEMLEALHDFKDYVRFTPAPRWEFTGASRRSPKPR